MYLRKSPESRGLQSSGESQKSPGNSFSYHLQVLIISAHRDSEDSAPAEYPPEQPEADTLDDDGVAYGAEEAELQAALEHELAETEANLAKEKAQAIMADGDLEMAGVDPPEPASKADEEVSEAESEDLEAESSGSDDEDEEEEGEGEAEAEGGEGDEDMEMGDGEGEEKLGEEGAVTNGERKQAQQSEVMVH